MVITDYKHAKITMKPNKKLIPVNGFELNDEGAHKFNEILEFILNKKLNPIIRTPSNGISYKTKAPAFDYQHTNSCVEITYLGLEGLYRFQFRSQGQSDTDDNNEEKIYGRQAFTEFKKLCKAAGIDLNDYAIENGVEVKKTIEKPLIQLERKVFENVVFGEGNVHHIDFHNSYPAGLCNTHPEFRPIVEKLYEERKTDPSKKKLNKAILNLTIGFMQSVHSGVNARWAHLSKDAIADNNNRIKELAARLKASGRMIISYNTDGIWYLGDIYHGNGEGSGLGQWENDHINCIFRAKSAGSYEFIEDGVYYPVVRGATLLDKIKPRTEWEWGDIYKKEAEELKYEVRNDGIYKDGVRL